MAPVIVGLVWATGRWRDCRAKAYPAGNAAVSSPMHRASSTAARPLGARALITNAVVRDAVRPRGRGSSSPQMMPRQRNDRKIVANSAACRTHLIPACPPAGNLPRPDRRIELAKRDLRRREIVRQVSRAERRTPVPEARRTLSHHPSAGGSQHRPRPDAVNGSGTRFRRRRTSGPYPSSTWPLLPARLEPQLTLLRHLSTSRWRCLPGCPRPFAPVVAHPPVYYATAVT